MPIITKSYNEDVTSGNDYTYINDVYKLANSLAMTTGATVEEIPEPFGWTNGRFFYVSMDSIGFPGWCVCFHYGRTGSNGNPTFDFRIHVTTEGVPDTNDEYSLEYRIDGYGIGNGGIKTCVLICDEEKDTVLFDIHNGSTTHGTDISYSSESDGTNKVTGFFAKDMNGNVLSGLGRNNICIIRTENNKDRFKEDWIKPLYPTNHKGLSNALHLTKMVNYLDPSYPEMKSAYVSVLRPDSDTTSIKRVSLYEINGIRWGTVGDTDWNESNGQSRADRRSCFSIDPFVRY